MIIWVPMQLYTWAVQKWPNRDVRIDTHLKPFTIKFTRPGWLGGKKARLRYKKLKPKDLA
jgi:hypothetical protein